MSSSTEQGKLGRRLDFPVATTTTCPNLEDLSQAFIDAIGTNKNAEGDFNESVERLAPLLKLHDSSALDAEQIDRVDALLRICVEALLYKYPTATLSQLFVLYLKVRMVYAGRIVMRKMIGMARMKIVEAVDLDETRNFFLSIPRFEEVPEFRRLVLRFLGERFFSEEG